MEVDGVKVGFAAKVGGLLFLVWSILHIWVMANGLQQYNAPNASFEMWNGLVGGEKVPRLSFVHPAPDSTNAYAMTQLAMNFCMVRISNPIPITTVSHQSPPLNP